MEIKFPSNVAALALLEQFAGSGARSHYEHVQVNAACDLLYELIWRVEGLEK